ncbi:MAG TPA: peptidoglycan-associated lipoprotein Pal, partial [Pseudobdellovibrionaceae bacterium]|nr:peptidoglycan-associated lipoprotein Pal [Pseudobdellovibrionaceae bacterium]
LSLMLLASVFIFGCKGKDKKAETAQESGATSDAPAVESTPMNFDVSGSDSGKIDGLNTVFFEYDKSSLDSKSKEMIKSNVDWMKKNSSVKLQLEGHSDSRGTIEYNLALGERRANAVKNYMVSLGVSADRMDTISYGEEKPLQSGENESAWSKNRRANFVPIQ